MVDKNIGQNFKIQNAMKNPAVFLQTKQSITGTINEAAGFNHFSGLYSLKEGG